MIENSPIETLLDSRLSDHYEHGLSHGLPPFHQPELLSTAFNSTPYVVSTRQLLRDFGFNEKRRRLLSALQKGIESLERSNFEVPFVLIGGSFTQVNCISPNDLDVLILYRSAGGRDVDTDRVLGLQQSFHSQRVDARLIPSDGDQLLLLKSFGYFCLLFSKNGLGSHEVSRSLLILNRRRK